MKFNEFNKNEKTNNLTEAPMGALKTFGLTSLSKVSSTAAGKLQTGTMANQLYSEFKSYLGQTGDQAEPEIVIQFLKSKGIPTKSAEAIMAQTAGDTKGAVDAAAGGGSPERIDPTMDEPAAGGDAAKTPAADAAKDQAAPGAEQPQTGAEKPAADAGTAAPTPGASPKAGGTGFGFDGNTGEPFKTQADRDASDAADKAAGATKPNFNNQTAGGKQTISTGGTFDPATMTNKPGTPVGPGVQGGVPSTTDPRSTVGQQAAPAADGSAAPTQPAGNRPQGGGRVAGQQSQTPGAIAKRAKRAGQPANGGSTSSALDQFVKTQMGSNPVTMKPQEPQQNPVPPKQKKKKSGAGTQGDAEWERNVQPSYGESLEQEYNALMEALSRGQLSKIFLAAAQDAARAGIGAGGQAAQGQQQGGQQQGGGGAAAPQGGGAAQGGQQQAGGGGFMAGLKAGFTGQDGAEGEEGGDVTGTLNVNQLAALLPGVDAKMLSQAVTVIKQGKEPNRSQMAACGQAFIALIKADPATTTQVMGMLKKISAK